MSTSRSRSASTSDAASPKKFRRHRGDGSLYQREDGRWIGAVNLGFDAQGRRIRRTVSDMKYATARAKLKELLAQVEEQDALALMGREKGLTVGEYLDLWYEKRIVGHRADKTVEDYKQTIRLYLTPYVGSTRLEMLKERHVQRMLDDLEEMGLASSVRRKAFQVLQSAVKRAYVEGLIDSNPIDRVPRPEKGTEHHPELSQEDAEKVFQACQSRREVLMATLSLRMGLRISEALGLAWDDVDLDSEPYPTVHLHSQARYIGGELRVTEGLKGTKPGRPKYRDLPLVPGQVEAFTAVPEGERAGFILGGETPMTPSRYRQIWAALLKRAGVKYIPPHGGRSTANGWLNAQGLGPRAVSDYLGHSDTRITSQYYHRQTLEGLNLAFEKALGKTA